jgi:hypothetical protein
VVINQAATALFKGKPKPGPLGQDPLLPLVACHDISGCREIFMVIPKN